MLRCMSPPLAQSGHSLSRRVCLLWPKADITRTGTLPSAGAGFFLLCRSQSGFTHSSDMIWATSPKTFILAPNI